MSIESDCSFSKKLGSILLAQWRSSEDENSSFPITPELAEIMFRPEQLQSKPTLMFKFLFPFFFMSTYLLIGYSCSISDFSSQSPFKKTNILLDLLFFLLLLLLLLLLLCFLLFSLFSFFFILLWFWFMLIMAVLPFDFCPTLAGLNFLISGSWGLSNFFLLTCLLSWLLGFAWIDFFLPFWTIYLHLDLLQIISPHDRLYFFLFSAIINLRTEGSSSIDLLFHFFWLWEAPLSLLILL